MPFQSSSLGVVKKSGCPSQAGPGTGTPVVKQVRGESLEFLVAMTKGAIARGDFRNFVISDQNGFPTRSWECRHAVMTCRDIKPIVHPIKTSRNDLVAKSCWQIEDLIGIGDEIAEPVRDIG